jgi:hypothetical protein
MGILVIGGVLFGTVLGRFFRVYILVPACGSAIILALARPSLAGQGLVRTLIEIGALIAGLQFGYVIGVFSSKSSTVLTRLRKAFSAPHDQASHTFVSGSK